MENTLDPKVELQYRNALKTVRRQLRQSGQTIDSRAHPYHQPRSLISSVSDLIYKDDFDVLPNDSHLPNLACTIPVEEGIVDQSNPEPPLHDAGLSHHLSIFSLSSSSRTPKLELAIFETNPQQDMRDVLYQMSAEARPNPLYTTMLVAEAPNDGDASRSQEALRQNQLQVDNSLSQECKEYFEDIRELKGATFLPNLTVHDRLQFISPVPPKKPPMRLSPPLLECHEVVLPCSPAHVMSSVPEPLTPGDMFEYDCKKAENPIFLSDAIACPKFPESDTLQRNQLLKSWAWETRNGKMPELETPLVLCDEGSYGNSIQGIWSVMNDDPFLDECSKPAAFSLSPTYLNRNDTQLQQVLRLASVDAENRINGERLDAIYSAVRLPVPDIEWPKMSPTWKHCRNHREMRTHLRQTMGLLYEVKPCRKPHKHLSWKYLPQNTVMNFKETVKESRTPPARLSPTTSAMLVQRPTQLKVLRDPFATQPLPDLDYTRPGDDDSRSTESRTMPLQIMAQTAPAISTFPSPESDLMALVRKRRAEVRRHPASGPATEWRPSANSPSNTFLLESEDSHATSKLLSSYMAVRAPKKAKVSSNSAATTRVGTVSHVAQPTGKLPRRGGIVSTESLRSRGRH